MVSCLSCSWSALYTEVGALTSTQFADVVVLADQLPYSVLHYRRPLLPSHIYIDPGDLNAGSHRHTAHVLPAEPPLPPLAVLVFKIKLPPRDTPLLLSRLLTSALLL